MKSLSADILAEYPEKEQREIRELLEEAIRNNPAKIIVLDDDPTGIQTVHGLMVYTDWSEESIRAGFEGRQKAFYILTNSRGFTEEETRKAHHEIGCRIRKISQELNIPYLIISRGDSTLRGHYPLETEVLREEIEKGGVTVDGEILCPFFLEGGRYTLDQIHYVKTGDQLIPVGESEFARDQTFGFRSSDLRAYIEEKTAGAVKQEDILCIGEKELRECALDAVTEKLMEAEGFRKIVADSMSYSDLEVFCLALYRAMEAGKHFVFRTASSIVRVMAGVHARSLLSRKELIEKETGRGGMIVVGSHTAKTTEQLERLKSVPGLEFVELNSDLVLQGEEKLREEADRVRKIDQEWIDKGVTVVNYTKRKVLSIEGDTPEQALKRSVMISDAVQSLVGELQTEPAFVIAKGGITSSDVGTKALQVKKALVLGQIRPGIPVWKTGEESKFPHIPYIIFPGNVGTPEDLKKAVEVLLGRSHENEQ